jgi:hypothetical protein
MVVARKIPTVPAPPVSRTASSQQTPRITKGKAPQTIPNTQGVSVADVSVPGASSGPDNLSNRSGSLNDMVSEIQLVDAHDTFIARHDSLQLLLWLHSGGLRRYIIALS